MAIGTTLHRFVLSLSHVDRGIYESLDLRVARHPSETLGYMLTRLLAYTYLYEEGIAFSKGGLSDTDSPALSIHTLDGRLVAWIEVGVPSPERLHKASKASPRVAVVTHRGAALLTESLAGATIHKKDQLELYAVSEPLLAALEARVEKTNDWALTFTEGSVYVTIGSETLTGTFDRLTLPG